MESSIKRSLEKFPDADRQVQSIKWERWQGLADQGFIDRVGIEGLTVHLAETMNRGEVLKNGSKSFVSRVFLDDTEVVVKGYRHLGLLHSMRHTLQGSRAKRSWFMAKCLCRLTIATPRPLAFVDEYRRGLLWRSYFIYEYISGPGLYAVLNDPGVNALHKKQLIGQVVNMLMRLSEQGISHGDLKHSNMICRGDEIFFIDLDALRWNFGPAVLKRYRFEKDKARFLRDIKDI